MRNNFLLMDMLTNVLRPFINFISSRLRSVKRRIPAPAGSVLVSRMDADNTLSIITDEEKKHLVEIY